MKAKMIIRFFLFIIILFNYGCYSVYIPQTVDIPLIKEKKDIRVDIAASYPLISVNSTVSYGLLNHVAIQLHGSLSLFSYGYQGAIGYFNNLGNLKILEIYAGYGVFNDRSNDLMYTDAPTYDYSDHKIYFTQINFGKLYKNFEYGFGVKIGRISSNLLEEDYFNNVKSRSQNYYDNNFLIEPTIFIRYGFEKVKFNVKLGSCRIYKSSTSSQYSPFAISLGLNFN